MSNIEVENKITDIIQKVHNKPNESSNSQDIENLKSLELAKIIVKEFLNEDNIYSLSFLNIETIDDFANAIVLNDYYDLPEIYTYINNLLKLYRSDNGIAFKLLIKMVMFGNRDDEILKQKGWFDRIIKR